MNKFDYVRAADPDEAVRLLAEFPSAKLLAGGTDLLTLMKDGLAAPETIIDLSGWQAGAQIEESDHGLRIGAMSTLAAISANSVVRSRFTALADACSLSAAPQLRNMGTIGGNLLQQTRCWYFRGQFNCWLKGGDWCYARNGQNEQHSIFNTDYRQSKCVTAHPSDPAAALLALDASIEYVTPERIETMPISRLFALPTDERRSFTTLPHGAIITAIVIPSPGAHARSIYRKAMARATWAFALAGVAISLAMQGNTIDSCRVVLSGVAQIPWRVQAVEDLVTGVAPAEVDAIKLAPLLTASAEPLAFNGYKVDLAQGLFKETLSQILAEVREPQ